MKILVLNGPNLNLLGIREPEVYGTRTYDELVAFIRAAAADRGIEADVRQSNHEGVLIDAIHEARGSCDGIVINAGAYTHTSIALLDALVAVGLPAVEVHLSDPDARDEFRRVSYLRSACSASVKGKGFDGYAEALDVLQQAAAAAEDGAAGIEPGVAPGIQP